MLYSSLWSVCVHKSRLVDLQLPANFCVTGDLLKQIADSHPQLERLALTSYLIGKVLIYLFRFTKLKSLSLRLAKKKKKEDDEGAKSNARKVVDRLWTNWIPAGIQQWFSGTEEPEKECDQISVGMVLDHLPILSLDLSREFLLRNNDDDGIYLPRPVDEIPSLSTTPQLIRTLKHLHIHYMINVECVEYFLSYCLSLETLQLDYILCWKDGDVEVEYPPLIQSPDHMSPFLKTVTLKFYGDPYTNLVDPVRAYLLIVST